MDGVERSTLMSRLERSNHTAFIDNNTLFVWGGYQEVAGEDTALPSDEIWLCDLDRGTWDRREISGDKPPNLSGSCGSYVNGTFYIFAGCNSSQYTSEMFSVDLKEQHYSWKRVTDTKGTTPSPRQQHSCWVHRDRLIYFGGYGCKTMAQNTSSASFTLEEMSWCFLLVNNWKFIIHVLGLEQRGQCFDIHTATWSIPETQGTVPTPRSCHASAILGNKGFISGGMEAAELDMFCLDLETWTWTQFDALQSATPLGRSMFTMTPISNHTVFIYGGVSTERNTFNDAWQFNTYTTKWTKMTHPHKEKPRVCHTACLGSNNDVVVFGGSSNMCVRSDLSSNQVAVLRTPKQHHYGDMFIFQTQPYSLCRLCVDFIGRNTGMFGKQLNRLPSQLRSKINRRVEFFSAAPPVFKAPMFNTD